MKLVQIWNARDAFNKLCSLKKPPQLAYRILKYVRTFEAELATCEAQREKCVYEAAGVAHGTPGVNLLPDTFEFDAFIVQFNLFLANESDLEPSGISMETLVEALGDGAGNTISQHDIALLEPFFVEKQPVNIKLVN